MNSAEQNKVPFKIKIRQRTCEMTLVFAEQQDAEVKRGIAEQIMGAYRERRMQEVK